MKRDDMLRMAREAGFDGQEFTGGQRKGQPAIFDSGDVCIDDYLMRFAALVSAKEREMCAMVACAARKGYADRGVNLMACAADYIACAIRSLKP